MKTLSLTLLVLLLSCGSLFSQHIVSFDLTTDNYAAETSWEIINVSGGAVAGLSSYSTNNNTFPTVDTDLPPGEYTFFIYDSFGDGICCGFGNGSFSLTDNDSGYVLLSGGDFGSEASVSFVLPFIPPILGCTDTSAFNFDSLAEQDDGSCIYEFGSPILELQQVANGFVNPVDISNAGDDRLFIVEKSGYIKILNADLTTEAIDFLNIDAQVINSGNERGLLGMAFHPDYANNGYFFVHYSNNSGNNNLSRFTISSDPNVADATSELIILTQAQPYSNHNAGDIAFGPDGYLYIPFGDGGSGGDPDDNGQNNTTWLGKMLRIDVDNAVLGNTYAIPADNPFVGDATVLDEIWSTGLRNPWRFSFDDLTGDLWIGDVGQGAWEEIDFEVAGDAGGRNYGWRCYEGTHAYNTTDCVDESELTWPVKEYNHSNGACSVTGGYVYRGAEFPALQGMYIYTDYCNGVFSGLKNQSGNWVEYDLLPGQGFGWTSFGENSTLDLFVANSGGSIHKILDQCSGFQAEINFDGSEMLATPGVNYTWFADGVEIEGVNTQSYTPEMGVIYRVNVENSLGCTSLSAEFSQVGCPVDVVPDGIINILDLVAVSSDFGCVSNCIADANGDGSVNILDIIEVSSNFGTTCP